MDDDYRCKEWAEMVSRLDGEWSYPYNCENSYVLIE
jgi:hypothetical protein